MKDPTNLGEVLRRMIVVTEGELAVAVCEQRAVPGVRIGEALVGTGACSDARVCEALELQRGLRSPSPRKSAAAARRLLDVAFAHVGA
jgi:hypothetical protein